MSNFTSFINYFKHATHHKNVVVIKSLCAPEKSNGANKWRIWVCDGITHNYGDRVWLASIMMGIRTLCVFKNTNNTKKHIDFLLTTSFWKYIFGLSVRQVGWNGGVGLWVNLHCKYIVKSCVKIWTRLHTVIFIQLLNNSTQPVYITVYTTVSWKCYFAFCILPNIFHAIQPPNAKFTVSLTYSTIISQLLQEFTIHYSANHLRKYNCYMELSVSYQFVLIIKWLKRHASR